MAALFPTEQNIFLPGFGILPGPTSEKGGYFENEQYKFLPRFGVLTGSNQ
jgi:hypothetical protein